MSLQMADAAAPRRLTVSTAGALYRRYCTADRAPHSQPPLQNSQAILCDDDLPMSDLVPYGHLGQGQDVYLDEYRPALISKRYTAIQRQDWFASKRYGLLSCSAMRCQKCGPLSWH